MAERTFTTAGVNNLWSNAANWDGGLTVPADGDDCIIPSGQTCTFDADQSAFSTGVKITITGTLNHALTGGPYTMFIKTGASVVGAGTWNVGTSANPIPFAVKHTITGASGWYVNGASGLVMTVYGAEPTYTYVKLSGAEAAGQTELSVDTDVTGDIWADGDTIHINNVNKASQSEERTIAVGGIAAGAITVTSGLTADKLAGSYVLLMTRNIKFLAVGNVNYLQNLTNPTVASGQFVGVTNYRHFTGGSGLILSGGTFTTGHSVINTSSVTINGGVFSNVVYPLYSASGVIINDTVVSGVTSIAFTNCYGVSIYDGIFAGNNSGIGVYGLSVFGGTYYGNTSAIISSFGNIFGGTFSNNGRAIYNSRVSISNATFLDNTQDIIYSEFDAYNTSFGSATEVLNYASLSKETFSYSIDHDQVSGAYKAWTKGGVTTRQAVTYPTGFTWSMQTVLESATYEGYWQKEITVSAGASVNITAYLRKDASMTYLPRVIIFDKATTDPFAGGTGLNTFTMTDAIDTWEDDLYGYTNKGSEDVTLVIRVLGKNATGNVYSCLGIEQINVDLTSALAYLASILEDTGTTLPASLTAIQADLDNPDQYKADVSALATAADLATVDGVVDAIKLKTDLLPADPADSSDVPTSEDVADAVWDELLSAHVIAGSSGAYLADSGASADPLLNTVPGSYASGTAGAALGRIGSGQITTVSPVAQDGDVETIQGDDYDNAHGRALDWTDDSAAWPELTDATIEVIIGGIVELAGSVVTATGDSKKVRVELTDVQTAAIRPGVHAFQVVATLSDADIVTLVEGNWTCKRRLAA